MGRKRVVVTAGLVLLALAFDAIAENMEYGYQYHAATPDVKPYAGYRWRPSDTAREMPIPDGYGKGFRGKTDPDNIPLPQVNSTEIYRPMMDQQMMSHHGGAFRFRKIPAKERENYDGDELIHPRFKSGSFEAQPKFRNPGTEYQSWSPRAERKYKFRSDSKFSNYSEGNAYSYPRSYSTPVFRKQNINER